MDVVLLFPGQGSQKPGMGKDLAGGLPAAARRRSSRPMRRWASRCQPLCFDGPADDADAHAQRAAGAAGAWRRGVGGRRATRSAPSVRAAAGHSLGEFTAYHAAGVAGARRTPSASCGGAAS